MESSERLQEITGLGHVQSVNLDRGGRVKARVGVGGPGRSGRTREAEGYARVEGARGEVRMLRRQRRGPEALSPQVAGRLLLEPRRAAAHRPGHKVADVVAIMGSVDPVFGEVDR